MRTVEQFHLVPGIQPVADFMDGTVTTDVVECHAEGVLFVIGKGVGATGTSTITALACDDFTPTTTSAVAFMYRASTTPDTWGDWTQATSAGFTTTAGSNQRYEIYVDGSKLAEVGYPSAQLKAVEVFNNPVLGFIDIYLVNPRFSPQQYTAIA
ncbi:MAG: hypothetical protein GY832_03830 [Chloroflexi bacterium]|nr:hypothetical protein [Chloroflexota bacterium]